MTNPKSENPDIAPWMLSLAVFWVCFVTNRTGSWGVDIWMYLSVGREVLENGIPSKLVFTFGDAAEMPYFAYEWLSSIAFYLAERAGGMIGLELMRYGLALVLFATLYRLYASISENRAAALLIAGIVIAAAAMRLKLRAEVFGYIAFMALLCCFVRYRATKRSRELLYALPIMLFWVNTHGSYLLGLLTPPLFVLSEAISIVIRASFRIHAIDRNAFLHTIRPYMWSWLGLLAVGLCNPYGIRLWRHSIDLSLDSFIPTIINEWMPTITFLGHWTQIPYFAMVVLVLLAALASVRRLSPLSWLLLITFGYLSISAFRHIYLFMFIGGMILADASRGRFDSARKIWGLQAVSLAAVLVSVAVIFIRAGEPIQDFIQSPHQGRVLPPMTVRFIEESEMKGPVINGYMLGNELVYRFHPRLAVSIDSRIDAYGQTLYEQNEAALAGRPEVFPETPEHMIVMVWTADKLAEVGFPQRHPTWRIVHRSEWVVIYARRPST